MPDELMKGFLEQVTECVDAFSDALNYMLHHYSAKVCEQESFGASSASETYAQCPCPGKCKIANECPVFCTRRTHHGKK